MRNTIGFLLFFLPLFLLAQTEEEEQANPPLQLGQFYADIHINSSSKPYNSRTGDMDYTIWEPIFHDCGYDRSSQMMQALGPYLPKYSQAHFSALARGRSRLSCMALSPVERPLINGSSFYNDRNKKATVSCMTGIVANQLFLRQKEMDYFADLLGNIEYLQRFEGEKSFYYFQGKKHQYEIIRNAEQLDSVLASPYRLGILLSIDGGHSLGHSLYIDGNITNLEEYSELMRKNIRRLKGLLPISDNTDEYIQTPIIWISLAKNYENGLGGMANSWSRDEINVFGKVKAVNNGPSRLGKEIIEELTAREGRRILIDVKHMSYRFRKYYYQAIERASILGEKIPVVCSHCGISGLSWQQRNYKRKDDDSKNNTSYLNHWTQNLSEEDLINIYKSGGLIGIPLDASVLGGQLALEEIRMSPEGSLQRKKAELHLFMANVLTVVQLVSKSSGYNPKRKSVWDIMSLGSDFDNIKQPLTAYPDASYTAKLAEDIEAFLAQPENISSLFTSRQIEELMEGFSPEELTEKIMSKNAYNFIKTQLELQPKLMGPQAQK